MAYLKYTFFLAQIRKFKSQISERISASQLQHAQERLMDLSRQVQLTGKTDWARMEWVRTYTKRGVWAKYWMGHIDIHLLRFVTPAGNSQGWSGFSALCPSKRGVSYPMLVPGRQFSDPCLTENAQTCPWSFVLSFLMAGQSCWFSLSRYTTSIYGLYLS